MDRQSYPLLRVVRREVIRMTSRPLYLCVCVGLPLFCIFFMSTIFGSGQMECIPVGVVDLDGSSTSRSIVRSVEASPTFRTVHYDDEPSARQAVLKKQIYGYMVVPRQFEQRLGAGLSTALTYYYHYALLSVGCQVQGAFETVLGQVAAAPLVEVAEARAVPDREAEMFIEPTVIQSHPVYNPDMNYAVYLSQPFLFVLLQVIILLVTVYAVGSEMKFGTSEEWLRVARGNIFTAVLGKMIPYTVVFIIDCMLANYVLFGPLHIPFAGQLWLINLATILLVVATQGLGIFVFSTFPALSIVISVASMIGSLGATLSGVTFPLRSMYPLFDWMSRLFPVRHFVEVVQKLLYLDCPFDRVWSGLALLLLFALLPMILLPRLKRAIIGHRYDRIE